MSEVTYEYIKGQGWVPSTGVVVRLKCGSVVRVEKREPALNEHYWSIGNGSYVGTTYGLSCEGVAKVLIADEYSLRHFALGNHYRPDFNYTCFTLVLV